jgi:hypothetical protein
MKDEDKGGRIEREQRMRMKRVFGIFFILPPSAFIL